ncbi:MAG TPA: hypothetical protein VLS28_04785 [Candidatus Sulfomarinibacteraceae bacterium]|nr:hypothetical protein [Candidatus Sulfomarinibacteraceae bacterium]
MASFVIETYVPQGDQERFAADVDGIRLAAEAIVVEGRVHHVRSYLVPGDEMGYHVLEARSAEDVVRVTQLAGIEIERVVEAIGVGPGRPSEDDPTDTP